MPKPKTSSLILEILKIRDSKTMRQYPFTNKLYTQTKDVLFNPINPVNPDEYSGQTEPLNPGQTEPVIPGQTEPLIPVKLSHLRV